MSVLGAVRSGYRGPVKRIIRAAGIEPILERVFWQVRLAGGPQVHRCCVGAYCADFYITTRWEYLRLVDGGVKEQRVIARFLDEIRTGDVVWDVGANIGAYTCLAAAAGGDVVAFEPESRNRHRLVSNVNLNDQDVQIRPEALGAAAGTATLEPDPIGAEPGRGRHALAADGHGSGPAVNVKAAHGLVERGEVPPPAVMKVDVEGGEHSVLRGCEPLLDVGQCRSVLVEVHPTALRERGRTVADVFAIFDRHGYETNIIDERQGQPFVMATR